MTKGDSSSEFSSQLQSLRNTSNQNVDSRDNYGVDAKISSINCKRARLLEEPGLYDKVPAAVDSVTHIHDMNSTGGNMLKDISEVAQAVPDVAAAIEDLLEQTRKVKVLMSF